MPCILITESFSYGPDTSKFNLSNLLEKQVILAQRIQPRITKYPSH